MGMVMDIIFSLLFNKVFVRSFQIPLRESSKKKKMSGKMENLKDYSTSC